MKTVELSPETCTDLPHCLKLYWLPKLLDVLEYGKKNALMNDFIVHGSYGDFTHTNFSDLELTIVAGQGYQPESHKASSIQRFLWKRLLRLLVEVDPLQHHGPFVLTRKLIKSYPESELPLTAYQNSWSATGATISVTIEEDKDYFMSLSRKRLMGAMSSLEKCGKTFFRYGNNLYNQKRLLSNIFMLPVFFQNALGNKIAKKEALALEKHDYPPVFRLLLERSSRLRKHWPSSSNFLKRMRSHLIFTQIPQGRPDLLFLNAARSRTVKKRLYSEVMPILPSALRELRKCFHEAL